MTTVIISSLRNTPGRRRSAAGRCGSPQRGAFGHQAGGEEAPQRHHQLARQGDDGDALDAAFLSADALLEPQAQGTVGLMAQP